MWRCLCDCGNLTKVRATRLKMGVTKSCGCLRKIVGKKLRTTHGMTETRVYNIWSGMKARCLNPLSPAFPQYGGRGIFVCEEWQTFQNFFEDMGHPTTSKHTIDRIKNDEGYRKDNCRWATPKEQSQNSSNPIYLTFDNKTRNLTEWADHLGINIGTLRERLEKWPYDKALSTPNLRPYLKSQPKSTKT